MEWLTVSARLVSRSVPRERIDRALEKLPMRTNAKAAASKVQRTRMSKELMTSVIWTTPLGLPVVQPYRKQIKRQVMTALQTVYISDPNQPAEVAPQKQATAFPPNFIHSLDATHMLLTALKCKVSSFCAVTSLMAGIRDHLCIRARFILDSRVDGRAYVRNYPGYLHSPTWSRPGWRAPERGERWQSTELITIVH